MLTKTARERSPVVLLVEDEETVSRFIRKVLESAGYEVLEATNSEEAMRIGIGYPDVIDVLLTDVRMPVFRNGLELADSFNALRPGTSVLLTSGSPLPEGVRPEEKGWEMLSKPFSPNELKSVLAMLPVFRPASADWTSVPAV